VQEGQRPKRKNWRRVAERRKEGGSKNAPKDISASRKNRRIKKNAPERKKRRNGGIKRLREKKKLRKGTHKQESPKWTSKKRDGEV